MQIRINLNSMQKEIQIYRTIFLRVYHSFHKLRKHHYILLFSLRQLSKFSVIPSISLYFLTPRYRNKLIAAILNHYSNRQHRVNNYKREFSKMDTWDNLFRGQNHLIYSFYQDNE